MKNKAISNSEKNIDICKSCASENNSPKIVVSRGNPSADLMIIGEAPGAQEDSIGEPFVGRSGKLLDQLLESLGFCIDSDVFICNLVKCRPPNNRRPTKAELYLAMPWLYQQIYLVDPLIIVLVGATAVEAFLGKSKPISAIRGTWQNWHERLVMPIFHPAYLLRNPSRAEGSPFALTYCDLLLIRNKIKTLNPNH